MAIRKIAQMGEPVLRRKAREITEDELRSVAVQGLLDDMVETMRDADGAGLAAPQVYESLRICLVEIAENPRYPDAPRLPLTFFINPVIEPLVARPAQPDDRDSVVMFEGCLSVQGIRGRVRRPRRVRVRALDRHAKPIIEVFEGVPAAVVQHEVDHLDGVLFVDRAESQSLAFLREYERFVPRQARIVDGGG